jgi:hypothetical protein
MIFAWIRQHDLCEGWPLMLLVHLRRHGVPIADAMAAMERMIDDVIAAKSRQHPLQIDGGGGSAGGNAPN